MAPASSPARPIARPISAVLASIRWRCVSAIATGRCPPTRAASSPNSSAKLWPDKLGRSTATACRPAISSMSRISPRRSSAAPRRPTSAAKSFRSRPMTRPRCWSLPKRCARCSKRTTSTATASVRPRRAPATSSVITQTQASNAAASAGLDASAWRMASTVRSSGFCSADENNISAQGGRIGRFALNERLRLDPSQNQSELAVTDEQKLFALGGAYRYEQLTVRRRHIDPHLLPMAGVLLDVAVPYSRRLQDLMIGQVEYGVAVVDRLVGVGTIERGGRDTAPRPQARPNRY